MGQSESDIDYLGRLRQLLPSPPRKLLDSEPSDIAERQANLLLGYFGVTEPPVPVVELAEGLGVLVVWNPDLEERGVSLHLDGVWVIVHRDGQAAGRNRAVAHQLKRMLDYPHGTTLYRSHEAMSTPWRQQYVSDFFAACLIMPCQWVRRLWDQGERDVDGLAALFATTPKAMSFRLEVLELLDDPDDALPAALT